MPNVKEKSQYLISEVKRFVQKCFSHPHSSLLMKGSAGSLLFRMGGVVFRFASGVILARILGASSYGEYVYATTWLIVLGIPSMLGMDHIIIRYVPVFLEKKEWGRLRAILSFSRWWGFFSALLVGLFACFCVWHWGKEAGRNLLLLVTLLALPLVVLNQVQQALLRSFHRPALAQIPEQIVYSGVLSALMVLAYFFYPKMASSTAALLNVFSWLGAFVLGAWWVRHHLPRPVLDADPLPDWRSWTAMMPGLVFFNAAYQAMSRTPTLALGFMGSSRDVGIYSVCSRGAEFAEFIYTAVTLAGASVFTRLYAQANKKELQKFVTLASQVIFFASLPVFIGLFFFAPVFLGFYGKEFVQGVWVMRVMLSTFFLSSLCGFVDVMLIVTGHQKLVAILMGILAVLNAGITFLLVPRYGVWGAALASCCSVLLFKGALVWMAFRKIGVLSFPIHKGVPSA